jgi:hypothetical protein
MEQLQKSVQSHITGLAEWWTDLVKGDLRCLDPEGKGNNNKKTLGVSEESTYDYRYTDWGDMAEVSVKQGRCPKTRYTNKRCWWAAISLYSTFSFHPELQECLMSSHLLLNPVRPDERRKYYSCSSQTDDPGERRRNQLNVSAGRRKTVRVDHFPWSLVHRLRSQRVDHTLLPRLVSPYSGPSSLLPFGSYYSQRVHLRKPWVAVKLRTTVVVGRKCKNYKDVRGKYF